MFKGRVDESVIIWKILGFDAFNKFYNAEWKPRKENVAIEWNIDPLISNFAESGMDANRVPHIELRHLPESFNDAFLVAHEILHVIRDLDDQILRFLSVNNEILRTRSINDMGRLASCIRSMFDDPIVDLHLQEKYHFDPARHYIEVIIPNTVDSLRRSGDPTDELLRMRNALFCAQYTLQVEVINDKNASREWNALKRQYQKRRPQASKMGEDVYSIAKKIGYNSLEKQKQLFDAIGNNYSIDGYKIVDIFNIQ